MLVRELRQAVRGLLRAPRFTVACIVTLALALTGTATLLNLLETFVFRRLAVAAPEQLVDVYPAIGETSEGFSPEAFRSIAARQEVLTGLCGVTAGYGAVNVQVDSGAVRQRPAEAVSGACYGMLGVTPFLGRVITTDDAPLTGEPNRVVLISHRLWLREFGARFDVLGRTLRVEGTPLTIVGVLPATYRGLNADEAPDIALPLSLPWTLRWQPPLVMHAIGRLRPGIDIARANAYLGGIWPDVFDSTESASTGRRSAPTLRVRSGANGFSVLRERYRQPLYVLGALAGCLLLLAAVNVGGLSLARLLQRRDRLAVRLALGASRWRLALRLWCEGMPCPVSNRWRCRPCSDE